MSFKEWKYDNKNTVPAIRKNYRDYVSTKILNLVNNNLQEQTNDIEVLTTESQVLPADYELPLN